MVCLEAPVEAEADIDVVLSLSPTGTQNVLYPSGHSTVLVAAGGDWTLGAVDHYAATIGTMHDIGNGHEFMYLVNGASGDPGTYSAGKFVISVEGYAVNADG